MKTTEIYTIWSATLEKALLKDLEHCFLLVTEQYEGPNRYYHNVRHIEHLMSQIKALSISEDDKAILIQVAVFHDVIYKAGRNDNESKSAEFAAYWLSKLNMGVVETQVICDIISATNTHESSDFLTQLFLDMDLSILGVNEDAYQEYTLRIRKEHIRIPNFLYSRGRKRFLKKMLDREVIFATPTYFEAFENSARKNLRNELNSLLK